MPKTISEDGEILSAGDVATAEISMVAQIARAEIDSLVSTARAYPRSITKAQQRMHSLATLDEASAAECTYAVPRGGKTIEGPSIRFAEMAAQSWGNARIASRTTAVDRNEKSVEAEGIFLDCETNVATLERVQRRIVDSRGKIYNNDMIIVTGNAARSIARRNAILAGIPKSVWRPAYEAARHVVMGDVKTLANTRATAITELQRFGLTAEQVFSILGVGGTDDIDREKLVPLRAMFAQLRNQEITVEELLAGVGGAPAKAKEPPRNPLDEPADKSAADTAVSNPALEALALGRAARKADSPNEPPAE